LWAVQAGERGTKVDGDSHGQAGGEAEHAFFAAGAGQPSSVEGGDGIGPVDGRHRGAVDQAGDGVHELVEEVALPQPRGVADQELDGCLETVQAAGVSA